MYRGRRPWYAVVELLCTDSSIAKAVLRLHGCEFETMSFAFAIDLSLEAFAPLEVYTPLEDVSPLEDLSPLEA